jgi:hypothetical protein
MNNEFLQYIENKIADANPDDNELEFDRTLLSLYKKGMLEVEMCDGEPFFSISNKGEEAAMNEVALSFVDPGEA